MSVQDTILWEIRVSGGSEKRIIEHTMSDCNVEASVVRNAIDSLLDQGIIRSVPHSEMDDTERRYCESDRCTIYRRVE